MKGSLAQPLLLFCLTLLIFANTITFPFVHDDIVFIAHNPDIGRWDHWPQIFGHASPEASTTGTNSYYRPLLEVIYRAQYALFGLNPSGWHAANAVVHGVNAVLVWKLLGLLGFGSVFGWAAALVFAVHPLQSEAVACVAGLSNLWMSLFVLLTLIFYVQRRTALALLCFLLGLVSKEQAVIALPLIILLDWWLRQKRPTLWVIFTLWTVVFLGVRQLLTGSHLVADILASPGELKLRFLAIAQVLVTDVRLIFAPYDLHYYRSTDILTASRWWWGAVAAAVLLIGRSGRLVQFGALWFIIALLPVLNIVPLINEYSLILTAEHFLYLPILGVIIIAGIIFKTLPKRSFIIIAVILGALTIYQNTFWRSESVLFQRTVRYEPDFGRGHLLLAKALYFEKRYAEADAHFARAYEIMDGYAKKAVGAAPQRFYRGFIKGILFDWAHNLENAGQPRQAAAKYTQAIEIDPRDPVLWNNLGALYLKMGDIAQAKANFQEALKASPDFHPAQQNLQQLP